MSSSRDVFLETADRIGARLCRDALWADQRCNWLGASFDSFGPVMTPIYKSFGSDLYGGTSGIALFLSHLFQVLPTPQYRTTALGAMRQALSHIKDIEQNQFGLYAGSGGVIYTLLHMGEIFEQDDCVHQALDLLKARAQEPPSPHQLDVIGGIAGSLALLLYAHGQYPHEWLLDQARRQGYYLLDQARKRDFGWSWTTLPPSVPCIDDLTGFSHGAAGIAWSLLELYHTTGDEVFLEGACEGFRYERHLYSPDRENWPDLRGLDSEETEDNGELKYMIAWCHGAPGIALSRLRAYKITGEQSYQEEAEAALRTTIGALQKLDPTNANYSLCHGAAGNADVLIYASTVLGDDRYRLLAERVGQQGIEWYESTRISWPSGLSSRESTPPLMQGAAGAGYFYLRLYDSDRVPLILIVTPSDDPMDGKSEV